MEVPKITVLMPVRNGGKYIKQALESVLQQTYTGFEFIIVDDGSTDDTVEIIKSYSDQRVNLIQKEHNFIENLNYGLDIAKGEYIARMDADDIMHSERLRIQLKRMESEPKITVLTSWTKLFKNDSSQIYPYKPVGTKWVENPLLRLLNGNFISHPTVMIRKSFLEEHRLLYKKVPYCEDYQLWFDIAKSGGNFFVEPRILLFYRVSEEQITFLRKEEMNVQSILLRKEILHYLLSKCANPILDDLFVNIERLEKEELISSEEIFRIYGNILNKLT